MDDITVMKTWLARARAIEKAHFKACVKFRANHYFWGAILIGSATLSSALTGIVESKDAEGFIKDSDLFLFFRICLAIFVPISAAVVSFLEYNVRSKEHHGAAAKFACLKRQLSIEISRREDTLDKESSYEFLNQICAQWNELTSTSPALYKKDWKEIDKYQLEMGIGSESKGIT